MLLGLRVRLSARNPLSELRLEIRYLCRLRDFRRRETRHARERIPALDKVLCGRQRELELVANYYPDCDRSGKSIVTCSVRRTLRVKPFFGAFDRLRIIAPWRRCRRSECVAK